MLLRAIRLPSAALFWGGLVAIAAFQVAATALISELPSRQAERAQKEALCAKAVGWVLSGSDQLNLERGKYLIRELDCDLVRESLRANL